MILCRAVACVGLFVSAMSPSPLGAQTPASAPSERPLAVARLAIDLPDERVAVFSNGLTAILKVHAVAPVVSVRMYCKTGSVYEQEYAGAGLSHLFEHLLHAGETTRRSEAESERLLSEIGGNSNAFTSFGMTAYYIDTTADHLDAAVDLLSDWITRPTFPEGPFRREWGVVQRELERDLDDPGRQAFQLLQETMYRRHPARFPIIGHAQAVQSLTKDDIVKYYRRMYVPDNVVVVIVGDIRLDAAQDIVARCFASFERRPVPTITLPDEPPMTSPRTGIKRMKVPSATLQLAWPSISLDHPDLYALDLLSYVLTEGESSCLVRSLVREQQLAFTVDSWSWTPEWGNGLFVISTRLAPAAIEAATGAIWTEIRRLQADRISDEELDQAKNQTAAQHVFSRQTAEDIAAGMASDFISTGDPHFSERYVARVREVTPEQIRDVARRYFRPECTGTVMILPEGESAPRATAPAATVEPARLVVLDNGLRVLIRRNTSSPLVATHFFCLGGLLMEEPANNGISNLMAELMLRGTRTRSAEEIARFFDSRGAKIKAASGNNTFYVQSELLKDDFTAGLEVIADIVANPAFAKTELERLKPRVLNAIARINENWRSELNAYFLSKFFSFSPYRMQAIGNADAVKAATPADLAAFHKRLLAASNSVLAIYGDVDEAAAEQLARKLFSGLPARPSLNRPLIEPEKPIERPSLYIRAKSPDRTAAGIYIGFRGMNFMNTRDRYPMAVLDTIMSGYTYPSGWLHEALRGGDRDLVYEVHAVNVIGVEPGYFGIYAACQPEKVSEVYGIITEQVERARQGRFNEADLARAKGVILTTDLMQSQTNSDRAMQTALDELYGLGYDHRDRYAEYINSVTLDEVRRVAKAYLTNPIVTVVTPRPEAVKIGIEPAAIESDAAAPPAPDPGASP